MAVNDVRFLRLPETYKRPRYLFLRLTVPPSLRRSTRIIAISADTKNDLVGLIGIPEDRIDVIPLAIPPAFSRVPDGTQLEKIKKTYHLPDHFILFVGHLEPRKNLPRLIEAYSSIRDRFDVELVVVGKAAWPAKSLLNHGRNHKLAEGIRFTGYVEDEHLPGLYSLARLLAFPSLHEGFGLPILEGMACGTPVVTSNTSALPEVAGDAAVLVDPRDVGSIAAGLDRVLNDSGLREELIAKGLQRVKHFQPKNIAAQIIESYIRALANPRQKPEQ
jgi:glycosyltransferase involved in cell wall biosynthesis